jgi:hypothetical protein
MSDLLHLKLLRDLIQLYRQISIIEDNFDVLR